MNNDGNQKVTAAHLSRNAYLYVRQSTMKQVVENVESSMRQYDLQQRAVALGWPAEQVKVIDSDLGQSGASTKDREGFQLLVTEVGMGRAGIVMGLEVSRLARNSSDWHRLLEICALTETLILDEEGIYDPSHFNDRLLLGLKGTMSEAELHILRARLRGGILNKAKRGELEVPVPIGFVYNSRKEVVLDPDRQIQEAVRAFFATFRRTRSALATVKAFRKDKILFPRRIRRGPDKGELAWGELTHCRALHLLHNPRYAGAFFFGRTRLRKDQNGRAFFKKIPFDDWIAFIPDAHEGYISWDEFQFNERQLRENSMALSSDRRKSPPREGPSLLQGLVTCGLCGNRMSVRYHQRRGNLVPEYHCMKEAVEGVGPVCQTIPGATIDEAVGKLLVELVTPLTLEVALNVQNELQSRKEEVDRLRYQQVERARYEAGLARRRYLQVDPDNRLVADELEAEWNNKLRAHRQALEIYEEEKEGHQKKLSVDERSRVMRLASDFPRLWHDPRTPQQERKRMVRFLIDDVTLIKAKQLEVNLRLKGGTTHKLALPRPLPIWIARKTSPEIIAEIDRLMDRYTDKEIADLLTSRGSITNAGSPFTRGAVARIRLTYNLKPRYERLREAGMLTMQEIADKCGICPNTVKIWRRSGLLRGHKYNDKGQRLFEPTEPDGPVKYERKAIYTQDKEGKIRLKRPHEVQYEA